MRIRDPISDVFHLNKECETASQLSVQTIAVTNLLIWERKNSWFFRCSGALDIHVSELSVTDEVPDLHVLLRTSSRLDWTPFSHFSSEDH